MTWLAVLADRSPAVDVRQDRRRARPGGVKQKDCNALGFELYSDHRSNFLYKPSDDFPRHSQAHAIGPLLTAGPSVRRRLYRAIQTGAYAY